MTRSSLRRGALAGALCALLLSFLSALSPALFGTEWWLHDWYARTLAARRTPDPRIVLVVLNDPAVRALSDFYGRPQAYSREVYARVTDELRAAGAAVVAFDVVYGEENPADPAGDRAFAESIKKMPVVLSAQTSPSDTAGEAETDKLWQVAAPASPTFSVTPPHPVFAGATGVGTIRLATSSGSSSAVHRYPLLDGVAGGYIPSLALETARIVLRAPRSATMRGGVLRFDGRSVPIDERGEMAVRWSTKKNDGSSTTGEHLSYTSVSLDKLILASLQREEGSGDPAQLEAFARQFRGKIVLVGFTAAALFDLRATPVSPKTAGIEIHANALDNLLNADFTRTAPRWLTFPLILLLGATVGAAVDATRTQTVAALIAVGAVIIVMAAGYLALVRGLVVPAFAATAAVALTYVVITVINFMAEQRQSAVLRTTFGRYVSPQILEHVLAHPEKVELGGERRDLTILFSDIRGFTSISEASEPEEVVEMLNEYLTRMVEILLRHGGTLDKFIGDAVMGFWNAPAFDPNHARNAVLCAIEMIEETARLRERWETEGKAAIRIGIGVNTGDAVVGNIGSERVFGYTVIGDAVNLASRLESKNKDYVTEIIISEFTLARIGDGFETVYLDDVKVKGKANAVKIYEVRGLKNMA